MEFETPHPEYIHEHPPILKVPVGECPLFSSSSFHCLRNYASLYLGILALIGFILMALYNIQEYIEDPFDQQGLDDLKFDKMLVGKNEILE